MRDPHGRRRHANNARLLFLLLPLLREAQTYLSAAATPVTLFLLAVQVALHYRDALLPGLDAALPAFELQSACILPARWFELRRLALAPLLHVDDVHLYYNMLSLISKGAALEPALGSERFGRLVVGLGVGAGVVHVALAFALRALSPDAFGHEVRPPTARLRHGPASAARLRPRGPLTPPPSAQVRTCAVGFSAVLFALKVVSTWNSRGSGEVAGIRLPVRPSRAVRSTLVCSSFACLPPFAPQMRWLCWGELLWIQLISPNVSFLGHLAGILAGILYIAPPRSLRVEAARLRRHAHRAWSAVAWAFSAPPQPRPQQQRAPQQMQQEQPARGVPTAEELRAIHVARFMKTQRPRGASPPPRRR